MPDFNNAGPQRSFDVIPAGTIATLQMTVRPGNVGDDGWLRRSNDGKSEGLDVEFTVVDGQYAKRKFWSLFTLGGTEPSHAQAADISRSKLRAILESARGIRPEDNNDTARQARQTESYGDFHGLRFIGRIGVEPAKDGYPPKNILLEAITPDRKDWRPIEQVAKQVNAAPTASTKPEAAKQIARPVWAS